MIAHTHTVKSPCWESEEETTARNDATMGNDGMLLERLRAGEIGAKRAVNVVGAVRRLRAALLTGGVGETPSSLIHSSPPPPRRRGTNVWTRTPSSAPSDP